MQKDTYQRLREEDRHIIYRMRKAGNTQQQIADILGYSKSTISKELSRNCGQRGYRPKQAHEKSSLRQANKASISNVISEATEAEVIERLKRKHSPEQIKRRPAPRRFAGSLAHEHLQLHLAGSSFGWNVVPESVHQWQPPLRLLFWP